MLNLAATNSQEIIQMSVRITQEIFFSFLESVNDSWWVRIIHRVNIYDNLNIWKRHQKIVRFISISAANFPALDACILISA